MAIQVHVVIAPHMFRNLIPQLLHLQRPNFLPILLASILRCSLLLITLLLCPIAVFLVVVVQSNEVV
jgi:hypothetical protein